jgi:ubiquinone/menaquinone biosynthesis C-methylase UbiE
MAVDAGNLVDSPDIEHSFTSGMEQFHHPRSVRARYRDGSAVTAQRQRLLAGLGGRVLEIGAGDGVKLSCYPASVEEIVLVEPDPFLRAAAKGIATRVATPVQILEGDLRSLPVADGACQAVVCSLAICCAPRVQETLREVRRCWSPAASCASMSTSGQAIRW